MNVRSDISVQLRSIPISTSAQIHFFSSLVIPSFDKVAFGEGLYVALQAQERPIRPGTYFYHNSGLLDSVTICRTCDCENRDGIWNRKHVRLNGTMVRSSTNYARGFLLWLQC